MRFYGLIDDYSVAIKDACVLHRVALYIAIERSFWVADIVAVEVESIVDIVIGW